ncbi:hypothetical protein C8F04DRAFT_1137088 [Mycena alexandri]|uniref:Uncharacterized protein n=1 Tax=Mycena alexandri TaxID=1745969 RepID=A0AAD6WPX2_9AGAR|nr:hypothetical protein C8F04DRAFT_1137088 [Mycena alexandri]
MKALKTLDDDILDRILTFLPDFKTLQAAIRSSKSVHAVFTAHPHSIVKAVAYNLIGPALLSAIHLIRNIPPYSSFSDPYTFGEAPPEPTEIGVITPKDARELSRNAVVVNTFHDIYSFRYKDRSTKSNRLTAAESFRFTRALYRIMLFADPEEEEAQHTARKEFFTVFPSPDLREIGTVVNFIEDLGDWLKRKAYSQDNSKNHAGQAKAVPPAVFLEAYQKLDPQIIDDYFDCVRLWEANELLDAYIHGPLGAVLRDRGGMSRPRDESRYSEYILDYVEGEDDVCQQCGAKVGIDAWTESNWEVQNEVLVLFRPIDLKRFRLEGRLYDNPREKSAWEAHIKDVPLHELLHDLFELKTPEYSSWSPQDKLCGMCLTKFMTNHIHLWLLQRKRQAGESIPKDCWFGYDCRKQFSNPGDLEHQNEFNHLCAPTKKEELSVFDFGPGVSLLNSLDVPRYAAGPSFIH